MNENNRIEAASVAPPRVFVTGGTGFIGRALIQNLLARNTPVRALVREQSAHRLPAGCEGVVGDALDARTFADNVLSTDSFVHLIGTPHPAPSKAQQFIDIDLKSIEQSIAASRSAGVKHFVYLSVAQPAPIMRAYIDVRARGEELVRASGIPATIVRPWYVLGPGRRWPLLLVPGYWLLERIPATRDSARRLGLVTLQQMVHALSNALFAPMEQWRVLDVPAIRRAQEALKV